VGRAGSGSTEFLPSSASLDSFPYPSLIAPWSSSCSNYSAVGQATTWPT
jgi:hypothetical protein